MTIILNRQAKIPIFHPKGHPYLVRSAVFTSVRHCFLKDPEDLKLRFWGNGVLAQPRTNAQKRLDPITAGESIQVLLHDGKKGLLQGSCAVQVQNNLAQIGMRFAHHAAQAVELGCGIYTLPIPGELRSGFYLETRIA